MKITKKKQRKKNNTFRISFGLMVKFKVIMRKFLEQKRIENPIIR